MAHSKDDAERDAGEDTPRAREPLQAIKTGTLERSVALTRLGVGAGAKIVGHSLANLFRGSVERDQAKRAFFKRQAQILADELGQLKGSVMKAGQMLSLYGQYFLPEEAVEVLSALQDDTAPVHWKVMRPVLARALGEQRLAELDIDETALAAASLGQVHRATRRTDGMDLCIKLQYPGVADAIDSDIGTLRRLLQMTRLAPSHFDLGPVFDEVREMLLREVDYVTERRQTQWFHASLADDPRFVVPRVIAEYSTAKVLTTSFERGLHVRDARVQSLPLARRNALGRAFLELFLREFFSWGRVQSDPHFGNYRIRLDANGEGDRIVLLDFGATRQFTRRFVQDYARIVRGALDRDQTQMLAGAQAIGLMAPGMPKAVVEAFAGLCETIVEPFRAPGDPAVPPHLQTADGAYRWGESDLPMRSGRTAALSALSVHFRIPPREIVFLHRRLAGVFIMLATLRCELTAAELLDMALGEIGWELQKPQ